jgi:hypothetical protein
MSQDKTPPHIKLDERNHVENPRLSRPGWDIIALMQDLLTGKKRVPPLLNDTEVASL